MKRKTIRNHKDFLMPKDTPMARTEYFLVKTRPVKTGFDGRYGIVVSKRKFKLAVQRNRAKRLLRDWIAFNEKFMLEDLDYVFIPNASVFDCSREMGRTKIHAAMCKISKIYRKNGK